MQQYAGIYLLQNHCTYFGCASHSSSGVYKTVTAASGTGHSNNIATIFLQRGQLATLEYGCCSHTMTNTRSCSYNFFILLMMGAMDTRNVQSDFAVNKYLHTATYCWIFLVQIYDARKHAYKIHGNVTIGGARDGMKCYLKLRADFRHSLALLWPKMKLDHFLYVSKLPRVLLTYSLLTSKYTCRAIYAPYLSYIFFEIFPLYFAINKELKLKRFHTIYE